MFDCWLVLEATELLSSNLLQFAIEAMANENQWFTHERWWCSIDFGYQMECPILCSIRSQLYPYKS